MVIPDWYNTVVLSIKVRKCDVAVPIETAFSQDYGIVELTRVI